MRGKLVFGLDGSMTGHLDFTDGDRVTMPLSHPHHPLHHIFLLSSFDVEAFCRKGEGAEPFGERRSTNATAPDFHTVEKMRSQSCDLG